MQKNYKSINSCKLDKLIENCKKKKRLEPFSKENIQMANKNKMMLNFMRHQGNAN